MLSSCSSIVVTRRLLLSQQQSNKTAPTAFLRTFHGTPKREIVPLLGAFTILFVARYSWKALKRMDDEWEDYQWHLKEYEKQHGSMNTSSSSAALATSTIGMDLGTVHMIWAHHGKTQQQQTPNIVPTHEGGRYTFAGVIVLDDNILVGNAALSKFYEYQHDDKKRGMVRWPYQVLLEKENRETRSDIFRALLQKPLTETLSRYNESSARNVVALPSASVSSSPVQDLFVNVLQQQDSKSTTTFVPEPVAAVWGAQQLALLPVSLPDPVLVMDVGGHTTTLSVVQKDVIKSTLTLKNIGGEVFLSELVEHVLKETSDMYRNDPMAVQRIYLSAEQAMAEFNSKNRFHMQIPYIGMDMTTKQPQHLDLHVSRSVLEQRVQQKVLERVKNDNQTVLSEHMPPPTDFTSLFTSITTKLLEECQMMPSQLSYVLLIGGGSKHPIVTRSVSDCCGMLMPAHNKLVIPELAVRSELVAIGAASLLPNYRYESERGLVRIKDDEQ